MKAEIKGVLSRILKLSMVCFQFENFKLKHCVKKVRKKISESALASLFCSDGSEPESDFA